jgi:hypothetical protein
MKYIKTFALFILFLNTAYGQDYINKFDSLVYSKNNINSFSKVMNAAKSGNSMFFMYLSYNINARNTMYRATSNIKYLTQNHEIISAIIDAGKYNSEGNNSLKWIANSSSPKDKQVLGKEVMLYEGYLFRYVAEYSYIIQNSNFSNSVIKELYVPIEVIQSTYDKWYKRLEDKKNLVSGMIGTRTHIGSHWATIAMYLFKLTKNSQKKVKYKRLLQMYDQHLRENLKSQVINGVNSYIWDSTWDVDFYIDYNKNRAMKVSIIQDVAHGNHIVQYIIDAYNLKLNNWTASDLEKLSNTLIFNIWKVKTSSFSDNVDGSNSIVEEIKGTGWKQTDGWMKLMPYNSKTAEIYQKYYSLNKANIDNTYYNLQFYANYQYFKSLIKL